MSPNRLHLAVLIVIALPAMADPALPTLEEVTVEATRTRDLPASDRPDPDDLAARRAATRDAAQLLSGIPGVSTWGAGGVSSLPAIRGLADDRLRVQVDGMELVSTCPNHMNPPLSYLAPAQVSAVTVYAGVVPVSLGEVSRSFEDMRSFEDRHNPGVHSFEDRHNPGVSRTGILRTSSDPMAGAELQAVRRPSRTGLHGRNDRSGVTERTIARMGPIK
jgi:hypothetical protein